MGALLLAFVLVYACNGLPEATGYGIVVLVFVEGKTPEPALWRPLAALLLLGAIAADVELSVLAAGCDVDGHLGVVFMAKLAFHS